MKIKKLIEMKKEKNKIAPSSVVMNITKKNIQKYADILKKLKDA